MNTKINYRLNDNEWRILDEFIVCYPNEEISTKKHHPLLEHDFSHLTPVQVYHALFRRGYFKKNKNRMSTSLPQHERGWRKDEIKTLRQYLNDHDVERIYKKSMKLILNICSQAGRTLR